MYNFFIDGIELPVTPSTLTLKIKNKNRTLDLINLGEINILKDPGLTDISFDVLLPSVKYPFAVFNEGFKGSSYYLEFFKRLKKDKKPFRFIVTRESSAGAFLFETNMLVSLENYSILEDANNGLDVIVSIQLREFKEYKTQTLKIQEASKSDEIPKAVIEKQRPSKEPAKSYTVKSGDTLWAIAKKELNNGSKFSEIAKLNNIKNPDLIIPGQVLRLG